MRRGPAGDAEGDACETDGDIDNDGLPDSEDTNPLGASGVCAAFAGSDDGHPSPAGGDPAPPMGGDASDNGPSWDSDGVLDGPKCALGHDPRDPASTPDEADCGGTGDSDRDGLLNAWETCKCGTSPNNADSDSEGDGDCLEAADVDGDGEVDFVGDAVYYAKAALIPADVFGRDGDGIIDFVEDVLREAKFALLVDVCQ